MIHARHTKARLFYCEFPMSYLCNITKQGSQYLDYVQDPQGVHLQLTKNYELRDPTSRGQFFEMLCRLISYLSSGMSRVPFLRNHDDNPINTVHCWLQVILI